MTGDDTVLVTPTPGSRTGTGRGRYHTDEECHRLPKGAVEKALAEAEKMGLEECGICAGGLEYDHTGETLAHQLEEMDP